MMISEVIRATPILCDERVSNTDGQMKSTAVKTTGTEFEFSAAKALFKTFFRDLQTSLSEWALSGNAEKDESAGMNLNEDE